MRRNILNQIDANPCLLIERFYDAMPVVALVIPERLNATRWVLIIISLCVHPAQTHPFFVWLSRTIGNAVSS